MAGPKIGSGWSLRACRQTLQSAQPPAGLLGSVGSSPPQAFHPGPGLRGMLCSETAEDSSPHPTPSPTPV